MDSRERLLLAVDASVNLLLGVLLLLAPLGSLRLLGLPDAAPYFYSSVLGAVLVGIGAALFIARGGLPGLGLVGAIAINLCGSLSVLIWLLAATSNLSTVGRVVLGLVAGIVLLIALMELRAQPWKKG
jgi:hypothetical protein